MNRGTNQELAVIAWADRMDQAADLAERLGGTFYGVHYLLFGRNPRILVPVRYFVQTLRTWQILIKQKPSLIHVTNPPIFAALNVFLYCQFSGAQFMIETHPPAIYSRKWGKSVPILRLIARTALVNIIDQERFKQLIESWGARAIVLSKSLRSYAPTESHHKLSGNFPITVVNTFAPDEPLEPILSAAKLLPNSQFYILGNTRLADKRQIATAPANVVFTGYLPHDQYWDQLKSSRAVMALTTYPYSLLAGATDGMSVGKPLLLSRQPVLTEYFTKGVIFIENSTQGIIDGVQQLQQQEQQLRKEIIELAIEKRRRWETSFQELLSMIGEPHRVASSLKI